MKITEYDIETAPNRCMVGFKDLKTGKIKQFQYNEGKRIAKYIKKRILVGFNILNYDNILLTGMLRGKNMNWLYTTSVDLVEGEGKRWDYPSDIRNSIDLIEVAQGKASLKLYGSRLNTKKLQDLPYDPHKKHTKKMWKNVMIYNANDLQMTEELYNELKPQLDIRADIGKTYGIDVMSRSDAQVAEDVFKKKLGIAKKPKIDKPKEVRYEAPAYIKFKSKELTKLKEKFESSVYKIDHNTGKFKPQEWLKEKIIIGGVTYTIGYGGLHSNEKSMVVKGDLKNADIASMYPSLIINSGKFPIQLGAEWLKFYKQFRDERMKIKHIDKDLSAMLKIFLNGSYGKLNSVYSILYAPHLLLDTTITGQLSLLMVIEKLTDAKIKVVSANTDGVEYVDKTNKGMKIIDKLGKKMNLEWEHASYKALYARDVNSYIAIYDDHAKSKGFYSEPKIDKNNEYQIVIEAIREFLLNGKSMKKTIKKCKDPAKFCVSRQVTGGALWSPETYPDTEEYENYIKRVPFKQNKALEKRNDDYKKQFVLAESDKWYVGKVVRYYYAKDGKPMFYKKSGNRVPKSDGCHPMMQLTETLPKDIDYKKYISLAEIHLKELGYE